MLSGFWHHPPRLGASFLPVIGPREDAISIFAWARPGDYLVEDEHVDALDVALSLE